MNENKQVKEKMINEIMLLQQEISFLEDKNKLLEKANEITKREIEFSEMKQNKAHKKQIEELLIIK